MRWLWLLSGTVFALANACQLFGSVRLTEVATAAGKPSNVATLVSVTHKDQPVTNLGVAAFRVSEDDQLLDASTIALKLLDPASVIAFHSVLLLDLGHATNDERRRQLSRAAAAFVRRVRKKQSVTVLAFDGAPRSRHVADFTVEPSGTGPEQLDSLLQMAPADPSRNLRGAVASALDTLDNRLERTNRPIRSGTLVVFSRGPDVAGRVTNKELDERISRTDHQMIYVDVAGDPTNDPMSVLMSRGRIDAQSVETLPIAIENAAILSNRLATQFYLLSYCSPARAGERRLRVEVQVANTDGKSDSDAFETTFDSTGFQPSCNSANAPRFSVALRSAPEHPTSAAKPAGPPSTSPPQPAAAPATPTSLAAPTAAPPSPTLSQEIGTASSPPVEPTPPNAKPSDPDPDVEVPPPKNRGYAP